MSAPLPTPATVVADEAPERGATTARWIVAAFVAAIAVVLVAVVLGDFPLPGVVHGIRYKTIARAVPIAWLVCLLFPTGRATLPYRPMAADVPLALFLLAAALSVALGGGHWGDVRNLLAAVALGLVARTLFAPSQRRSWLIAAFTGTVLLILARELSAHPDLLPPHELGRYDLVTANPNVLGFLFAMMAPVLLAAALAERGTPRLVAALGVSGAVLGTLLTYSRVAAVGLGVGTLVVAASLPRARRALWVVAFGAAAFVAVSRPDRWIAHRAPGDDDRPRIMYTALLLAREHPVLGIGFGINNLEERFPDRYQQLYGERVFRFHAANQVIDLLVGTGIVGTALALWWAGRIGAAAFRRWRAAPAGVARITAAGGLGACVAIALMSLAEPPLYHGKLVPLLFLVLAWVEAGVSAPGRPASARATRGS